MAPSVVVPPPYEDICRDLKDMKKPGITSLPTQPLKPVSPQYAIREEPIRTRRPLRVVCMGTGYSGLMMAIVFTQKMQDSNAEFVIYERNADLGGTWLENRYPGCQCDIPAHNYAYSFEPNPSWPNYYATAVQIFEYMKKTSAKYDADQYMKFSHEIKSAVWDEADARWKLKVRHGERMFEDTCDVFINAGGVLNAWKYPDIDGIETFKGKLLHSASWDESYNFEGKKVAVIGIGSSGIQIVPKIAPVASQLTSFVRSKTWISPAPGINEPTASDPETDEKHNYAPHVVKKFEDEPEFLLEHRRNVMDRRIENFQRAHAASEPQKKAQVLFRKTMTERLGDSEKGKKLAEMLIPDFPVGCRRQTPGPNFLETLIRDNVDTRWDDIAQITEKGILTKSGEELEFDAIVCATGFNTSFQPRFPIIGRNGASLAKQWQDIPEAYFGITVPNFPNYFSKL
jgi:cation diffusion facilitator CzcD-associated flavoprotein CzcO